MLLNQIQDNPGARKKSKRVGRGIGSGKGKTCGSGTKGQKSRTGVAINGFEGGQNPIHRRLPKRGFNQYGREEFLTVNLGTLERVLTTVKTKGEVTIDNDFLYEHRVIKSKRRPVKLLGQGKLTKAVTVQLAALSKSAAEAVTAAGGKIIQ